MKIMFSINGKFLTILLAMDKCIFDVAANGMITKKNHKKNQSDNICKKKMFVKMKVKPIS